MKTKLIILIIMILMLVGCTSQSNIELKEGKYVLIDSEVEDWAWVILEKDNQFEFNRGMATSYRPSGTYKIEDNILTLSVHDDETYRFTIDGDQLIFIDGEYASELIEEGMVFEYTKQD